MAKIIQTVSLKDARFYAPIGFYEEEQLLGNEFFLTIDVSFPFQNADAEELKNTLNYEDLYQIANEVMTPTRKLLESAAEEILNRILNQITYAESIYVAIRKSNPPFGGDICASQVALSYFRD